MKFAKLLRQPCVVAFSVAAQTPAPRVAFETSEGKIVVELAPKAAPKTVDNFLTYVKAAITTRTCFIESFRPS